MTARPLDASPMDEGAARALAESDALLAAFFDVASVGLAIREWGTGRYLRVNQRYCEIVGYPAEELVGRRTEEITHPDDRPAQAAMMARLTRGEVPAYVLDKRYVRKDGGVAHVHVHAAVIRDRAGAPVGTAAVIQDLTEMIRAEERIRASAAILSVIGEASPGFLWVTNAADRSVDYISRRWLEYTGQTMEELRHGGYARVVHPDDLPLFLARLEAGFSRGVPFEMEVRYRRRDGEYRWFAVRSLSVHDAAGQLDKRVGMAVDIHDRRLAEEALRASEERERARAEELATVLRAVPAAVWIAHDPACEKVTGSDFSYATLRLPLDANPSKTAPEPERPQNFRLYRRDGAEYAGPDLPLQVAAAEGVPVRGVHVEVRFEDGTSRCIYGNAEPLFDAAGRPRGAVSALVDITQLLEREAERARLLEEARAARAEAEAANQMKSEMLAVVSHELRTPLNAILGWTNLLRRGGARDRLDRALEVIERNAKVQAQIIEDLLDVSRIVSGKLRLAVGEVDLARVIAAAVESVTPAAEARGVRLHVGEVEAPPVPGDAARLQQVMVNLLSNAVKFTERDGRVDVAVRGEGDQAIIEVRDTGRGIDPAFLPQLFEPFRQGDAREHGGLGLGLAIVRNLVEMHGGAVEASSAGLGAGARFSVRLPAGAAPSAAAPRGPSTTSLAGLKVLVVDDVADAREVAAAVLGENGAEVITASSAGEAFDQITRAAPDVLVSDIGMPGEDGLSLIRRLRAQADAAGGVPAVALTAHSRIEQRVTALQAGFDVHLSKPLDPDELVATVARLGRRASR